MRQCVIARQVRAVKDAGLDALASCHDARHGEWPHLARQHRDGGEYDPRRGAAGYRDRGMARVQVRGDASARRPIAQARPRGGPRIETDYIPVGHFAARLREIKTPPEADILRRLSRIAEDRLPR